MSSRVLNKMNLKAENFCEKYGSYPDVPMGKACLMVHNMDMFNTLELWAQSEECNACPPWRYSVLNPAENSSLVMNSTYPTKLFLYSSDGSDSLCSFRYHFLQQGWYTFKFNSSCSSMVATEHQGDNGYQAIFGACLFFLALGCVWCCISCLQAKMEDYTQHVRNTSSGRTQDLEPLISDQVLPNMTEEAIPDSSSIATRLNSLDAFRGIAIMIMIFVNYGGGSYSFFKHSVWNGLTVADLAFPWFLWIMGVSLTFSLNSQLRRSSSYCFIMLKVIQRSVTLFVLGLVVNSIRSNNLPEFRLCGVLQRFAFCYMINALLEMLYIVSTRTAEHFRFRVVKDITSAWIPLLVTVVLVLVHTAIIFFLPVPGCPSGYLGPGGLHEGGKYVNCTGGATTYVDKVVLGEDHMYMSYVLREIYDAQMKMDPEGIMGVLTSCLTVQLGAATGRIILHFSDHWQRIKRWILWGLVLGAIGGLLCNFSKEGGVIPVNKRLWSLSYVCVTSSFAFLFFSILYYAIDCTKWSTGSIFRAAGMNAILLYVGHEMTKDLFPWSWTPIPPYSANHLFMSTWGTLLWFIIALICHRKKLYLTV